MKPERTPLIAEACCGAILILAALPLAGCRQEVAPIRNLLVSAPVLWQTDPMTALIQEHSRQERISPVARLFDVEARFITADRLFPDRVGIPQGQPYAVIAGRQWRTLQARLAETPSASTLLAPRVRLAEGQTGIVIVSTQHAYVGDLEIAESGEASPKVGAATNGAAMVIRLKADGNDVLLEKLEPMVSTLLGFRRCRITVRREAASASQVWQEPVLQVCRGPSLERPIRLGRGQLAVVPLTARIGRIGPASVAGEAEGGLIVEELSPDDLLGEAQRTELAGRQVLLVISVQPAAGEIP